LKKDWDVSSIEIHGIPVYGIEWIKNAIDDVTPNSYSFHVYVQYSQ